MQVRAPYYTDATQHYTDVTRVDVNYTRVTLNRRCECKPPPSCYCKEEAP